MIVFFFSFFSFFLHGMRIRLRTCSVTVGGGSHCDIKKKIKRNLVGVEIHAIRPNSIGKV